MGDSVAVAPKGDVRDAERNGAFTAAGRSGVFADSEEEEESQSDQVRYAGVACGLAVGVVVDKGADSGVWERVLGCGWGVVLFEALEVSTEALVEEGLGRMESPRVVKSTGDHDGGADTKRRLDARPARKVAV